MRRYCERKTVLSVACLAFFREHSVRLKSYAYEENCMKIIVKAYTSMQRTCGALE